MSTCGFEIYLTDLERVGGNKSKNFLALSERWRIWGGRVQIFFIFMQFSGKNGQIVGWRPLKAWRPLGNLGSVTALCACVCVCVCSCVCGVED